MNGISPSTMPLLMSRLDPEALALGFIALVVIAGIVAVAYCARRQPVTAH